jgi:hypothetical protein
MTICCRCGRRCDGAFRTPPPQDSSPPKSAERNLEIALAAFALIGGGVARAEETVGLWVKNTAPMPVVVSVDGVEACRLEAPVYKACKDEVDISKVTKGKKKPEAKFCTTNNLKISCITNVPAAGANVSLRRIDGVEYKMRAAKGGTLYLCIEPTALTDCFGKKLQ